MLAQAESSRAAAPTKAGRIKPALMETRRVAAARAESMLGRTDVEVGFIVKCRAGAVFVFGGSKSALGLAYNVKHIAFELGRFNFQRAGDMLVIAGLAAFFDGVDDLEGRGIQQAVVVFVERKRKLQLWRRIVGLD